MSKIENVINHSRRDKYRQLTVSAFAFIKIQENKKQKTQNGKKHLSV